MKKTYFFVLFLLFQQFATAQFVQNPFFGNLKLVDCPFDASKKVLLPEGWFFYQTFDGFWDGKIDSSRCIAAQAFGSFNSRIDLSQLDLSRPFFIRQKVNPNFNTSLSPNQTFQFRLNFTVPQNVVWKTGSVCPNEICTGAAVGIAIPDKAGNDFAATRFQTVLSSAPASGGGNVCVGLGQACVPTEYFKEQKLVEVIVKFTFDSTTVKTGDLLQINSIEFYEGSPFVSFLDDFVVPTQGGGDVFEVQTDEVAQSLGDNIIGRYDPADGYPEVSNPSFIEATLLPNPSQQKTVNLIVSPWQTFEFQPFTYLRGGKVAGSDSLRHQVNLLNDGGTFCLSWVDHLFQDGESYHHNGGQIEFNNAFSCLQFRPGGELRVMKNKTLHYGNNGSGMLAMCAGGGLVLEENSMLVVDAIFNLSECNDDLPPSHIFMDLPRGTKLVFTKNARLTNQFSKNQAMKLKVRMLGGEIDDAALPLADREIIERIYPNPQPQLIENLQVAPNLFQEKFALRYLAAGDESLRFQLFDAAGRMVFEKSESAEQGFNFFEIEPPSRLPAGFYFLNFENGKARTCLRLARI